MIQKQFIGLIILPFTPVRNKGGMAYGKIKEGRIQSRWRTANHSDGFYESVILDPEETGQLDCLKTK
jgi:uncharacterized protein YcnI